MRTVTQLPPPRRICVLPSVVAAVLTLAFVGSAHAFTVEIVRPEDDPAMLAINQRQAFVAVAYDEQSKEITEDVDWSWDFADGHTCESNPTQHAFETPGEYTVTVWAVWSELRDE